MWLRILKLRVSFFRKPWCDGFLAPLGARFRFRPRLAADNPAEPSQPVATHQYRRSARLPARPPVRPRTHPPVRLPACPPARPPACHSASLPAFSPPLLSPPTTDVFRTGRGAVGRPAANSIFPHEGFALFAERGLWPLGDRYAQSLRSAAYSAAYSCTLGDL